MKTNYFGGRVKKAKSSERAEAMPAAIITAIVSSILLLGIASAVSLVVQNKGESESNVALATVASNIDVSLRSDINQASYISASAKLKQPSTRLLNPTDLLLSGVNMHVPASSGECKVIRWNINGTTASRDLTVYKTSLKNDAIIKCDETSPVIAKRTKVFAQNVNVKAPFTFNNQVGRELSFTIADAALTKVNIELDKQLKAKNVQRLADSDFNELNKLMGTDSYAVGFRDPAACVMNATKVSGACPPAEADTVTAAWNSLKIAKVNVNFEIQNDAGEVVKRDIAQNSSVPLYADAAEAEASVADSSADNRPAAPVVNISTNRVILGTNYTINWTSTAVCPADMVRTFKLYENNVLIKAQSTAGFTKNFTNSAVEYVNYNVQVECVRGALVVVSDMSAPATAKVIPAVPAMIISNQPPASNAALNANLTSTATCLYGTTPRYNIRQIATTYGTAGTAVLNVTSVNRPINAGFTVVEGARYQYAVEAWCISAYDQSANNSQTTNSFTTFINAPIAPTVTSPVQNATNVSTNAPVTWNPVTCATGTTVKYFAAKDMNAGAITGFQVINNWTANTNLVTNNTEGNTVRYVIQGRCEGTAVTSNPSSASSVQYTTAIFQPGAPVFTAPAKNATGVATFATVTWSAVTCAPATTVQYYTTQNLNAGAVLTTPTVIDNWSGNTSFATNNTQGNRVGYTVAARCAGPNASSTPTATDSLQYTTAISAPVAPAFTAPANNATGVATNVAVTWSTVTCATGTNVQYYTTKNVDKGATLTTPTVIGNWTAGNSFTANDTQGNTVGYTVAARCAGPDASSVSSPTATVKYTTLINAPAAVKFIAPTPANNSTGQSTSAVLTWSSVACATGTTTKYYTTKDVNAGVAITPIVIDNWTTDLTYTTSTLQGHTVRYTVKAKCDGPNVDSAETATDTRQYTTAISAPSGPNAWNNGWSWVDWNAPTVGCATGTTIKYRLHQVKADNNVVDVRTAWQTGGGADLPTYNTGGYPQWANVEALCDGPNADSAVATGNTTKWIKQMTVSFNATQQWRRINVAATCSYATTVGDFWLYVAADGWGGARGVYGSIQTDEGATIADAQAGVGGNTGWLKMNQTQNQQWNANVTARTTYNWGYWGNSGWGSTLSGQNMSGTYWNASGWGSWAYWYTGYCSSPYMVAYGKGTVWNGGTIRNAGVPGTWYNARPASGTSLTTAGVNAIK